MVGVTDAMPASEASSGRKSAPPQGLFFLFSAGERPTRGTILALIETMENVWVSFDPASAGDDPRDSAEGRNAFRGQWLELMMAGLTFDLLGLAPLPAVEPPAIAHRLATDQLRDSDQLEGLALVPGPHIADGANSLPIVRAMLDLGCRLASGLPGIEAVCWSPARTAIETAMFCRLVEGWMAGGPFPALGLTAFAPQDDGSLVSEGLGFFVGQELRLSPPLCEDRLAATRMAMRLVHEVVGTGRIESGQEITLDSGERLWLSPGEDRGLIEVARM